MPAPPRTIETVIAVFRQAAAANRGTPGRQGSVVTLNGQAHDLVVGADLHGHRLNLRRIVDHADLGNHPRRHLVLQEVCHGGPSYPGARGCMSHLMLEDVAQLKMKWPGQVHFLLSNHELAEVLEQPIVKGNQMLNLQFRLGMEKLYGNATELVREAAVEFIGSCPLAVRTGNRLWLSHSLPQAIPEEGFDSSVFRRELREQDLAPGGPAFRVVWGRDFRQVNADAFAALIDADLLIHGHEPCPDGYRVANSRQLILDSSRTPGCCLTVDLRKRVSMDDLVAGIRLL